MDALALVSTLATLVLVGGAVRVSRGGRLALAPSVLAAVVLVAAAWAAQGRDAVEVAWAPELGLALAWQVDGLTAVLLTLVGGVAAAVIAWLGSTPDDVDRTRLVATLLVFVAAMAGLLTAANALTLFVFWELTTLISYALIGFDGTSADARRAARTSLLVTGLGGLALLAGAVMVTGDGAATFATLATADAADPVVVAGAFLLLLAAATKSAQVPFHGWLTGAMTAPTAASALLHAATLVIAGVYLVLRVAPLGTQVPGWTATAVATGLATYVWAHWGARRAADAKRMLAGTTAAQMGFAFALAALGTPKASFAAVSVLIVHGVYKAGLFLLVGTIKQRTGSQAVDSLRAAVADAPALRVALWTGAAALAGLPPLAGWVAKEAGVAAYLGATSGIGGALTVAAIVAGTALGVAVAARLVAAGGDRPARQRRVPVIATLVPLGAGVLTVALGLMAPWLARLARVAAAAVTSGDVDALKLVVWPGVGAPLVVSLAGIVAGAVLAVRDRRTGPQAARLHASDVLARAIDGLGSATAAGATLLHGLSRRMVLGTILTTTLVAVWPAALAASRWPDGLAVARNAGQLVAAVTIVAATVAILRVRERFPAAVLLGVVGFGMGGLFVVQGAPDLVLTQIVVETVVVVAFAGVLRRLPRRSQDRPEPSLSTPKVARFLLAGASGLLAADLALSLADSPAGRPVAEAVTERALPDGGGANIVNVILTDFRAIDTVGELMVLFLAAAGVLGVLRSTAGGRR